MPSKPRLQFSIPVKTWPDVGFPEQIAPYWTDVGVMVGYPMTIRMTVINKWIGGVGEWYFRTRFEPASPGMTATAETPLVSSTYDFEVEGDPFLDVVRQELRIPRPSPWLCILECGGDEILRYPIAFLGTGGQGFQPERI